LALSREVLAVASTDKKAKPDFEFRSVAPIELPAIFEACHRSIWKAEKRSPASAFYEFAKIMFVKIDEDRRLHEFLTTNKIDTSSALFQEMPSDFQKTGSSKWKAAPTIL